jgi:integral membrane protein (TIGR01906 family)
VDGYDEPMQPSPIREAVLSIVVAVATMVVIAGVSVALFLTPTWVGFEQGRSGAAALTGYTAAEVDQVTGAVLHDLVIGPPAFAQTVDGLAVFDQRERAHLVDVRSVFGGFGILVLLGFIVLVVARIWSHGGRTFRRGVGVGALVLAAGVVIGGLISAVAFDQAFETFHELFFAGGTYTFDPITDRLVQLFPIQFWEETSLAVGAVILLICSGVSLWALRPRTEA